LVDGFTKKYGLDKLVYYEVHETIEAAILREKQMKEWQRNWKLRQIMDMNPEWTDLYTEIVA
jgi:putative endonuclease